jgi:transcriptional regulator with XRE-family HTH domain
MSDIDSHIGRILRRRRRIMDLTLREVADPIGLSFQHLQKLECGMVHITAIRLWQLSNALQMPVAEFFAGLESRS